MTLTFKKPNSCLSVDGPLRQTGLHFIYPHGGQDRQALPQTGVNLCRLEPLNRLGRQVKWISPSASWKSSHSYFPLPLNMCFISALFGWKVILPSFIEGHKIYSVFFNALHNIYIFYCINVIVATRGWIKHSWQKPFLLWHLVPYLSSVFYMQPREQTPVKCLNVASPHKIQTLLSH